MKRKRGADDRDPRGDRDGRKGGQNAVVPGCLVLVSSLPAGAGIGDLKEAYVLIAVQTPFSIFYSLGVVCEARGHSLGWMWCAKREATAWMWCTEQETSPPERGELSLSLSLSRARARAGLACTCV
jgi:hypothetical protein